MGGQAANQSGGWPAHKHHGGLERRELPCAGRGDWGGGDNGREEL